MIRTTDEFPDDDHTTEEPLTMTFSDDDSTLTTEESLTMTFSVLFAQPLPPDDDFSDSHHLDSANKPTSLTTDIYRTSDSLNNLTSDRPMSAP